MKLSAPLVYGLVACTLLVSAPHAGHLPVWVSAVSLLLLAWRSYLAYSSKTLPSRWLLTLITLACAGAIVAGFHALFGREVGVTLLILLTSLKLLELRSMRDATLLIYLCCFIIITNFFYSQSLLTALLMLLTLLAIMTTWVHVQTDTLALKPRARIALTILLQAIPLSLLIFVLFPRVQGPLWGLPQDAYASSGLSDTMSPGSMSKLTLSDAVAFRVNFSGPPPLREQMYWRGPVLSDFDGRTWTRGQSSATQAPQLLGTTTALDYTVTLEPHNKLWLFALDMPDKVSVAHVRTADFQLLSQTPVTARLRYSATSQLSYRANPDESPQQLRRALALPRGFNPRAKQLAAEWRAQNSSAAAVVKTALAYFNRNGFAYTLEPPPLGSNSVDDFLFETRQGFCEYYASSFVFLMRAAGIPARVVTGYQGGEYNTLGGYYILRQADAHAWAEVWLPERGWVRYDPTAAIAPSRIQSGLGSSLADNAGLPFLLRTQSPLLLKLRLNLDALSNQWNQWVLSYDNERQFALLSRLGMQDITWQKLALYMFAGVASLAGIFALFMLRRLKVRHSDAVHAAWLKLCHKLEKAGLPRAAHEGAQDYAQRIADTRPELGDKLRDLARSYTALRYGKEPDAAAFTAFKDALRSFKL